MTVLHVLQTVIIGLVLFMMITAIKILKIEDKDLKLSIDKNEYGHNLKKSNYFAYTITDQDGKRLSGKSQWRSFGYVIRCIRNE